MNQETPPRLFLSYGHDRHTPLVERIHTDLETAGFAVWIDTAREKAGDHWRRAILDGLQGSDGVLAFLSEHSMRDPGACRDELAIALHVRGVKVLTVLLEDERDVAPPAHVAEHQWLDLKDWTLHGPIGSSGFEEWYRPKLEILKQTVEDAALTEFAGEIDQLRRQLKLVDTVGRIAEFPVGTVARRRVAEVIESWRATKSQMLLVTGSSGSGKSVIAAQQLQLDPHAVAGVFCDWQSYGASLPLDVFRRLAFILATRLPDYRRLLLEVTSDGNQPTSAYDFFIIGIVTPLRRCVDGGRGPYYFVIDALDEADDAELDMAQLLADLSPRLPAWMKVVVTTQPQRRVLSRLDQALVVDLADPELMADEDVEELVAAAGRELPAETRQRLVEVAAGNFRYVSLAIRTLEEDPDADILKPRGLGVVHRNLLNRAAQYADRESVRRLLGVIVTDQGLTPVELQSVVAMEPQAFQQVLGSIGGLVERKRSHLPQANGWRQEDVLSLAHRSVRDWLTDPDVAENWYVSPSEGASVLADYALGELGWDVATKVRANVPLPVEMRWRRRLNYYLVVADRLSDLEGVLLHPSEGDLRYWDCVGALPDLPPGGTLHARLLEHIEAPGRAFTHGGDFLRAERLLFTVALWLEHVGAWQPLPRFLGHFLRNFPYARFFRSATSDDERLHEGWKTFIAGKLASVVRRLDAAGVEIDDDVRGLVNHARLSSLFFLGGVSYFLPLRESHAPTMRRISAAVSESQPPMSWDDRVDERLQRLWYAVRADGLFDGRPCALTADDVATYGLPAVADLSLAGVPDQGERISAEDPDDEQFRHSWVQHQVEWLLPNFNTCVLAQHLAEGGDLRTPLAAEALAFGASEDDAAVLASL